MGKQYNKVEKRGRRLQYNKRKREAAKNKKAGGGAKAAAPAATAETAPASA